MGSSAPPSTHQRHWPWATPSPPPRRPAPPNVVAERLGHNSTKMTLDRSGHVLQGRQEDVARQVDTKRRAVLDG